MGNSTESTSLTLLQQVQQMQPAAWSRLVDLYAPLVRHWCRSKGLSREDTADVFQEVFRAVANHVQSFRRDRPGDTFRGWLKTITHNKIHDHFRRFQSTAEGGTAAQIKIAQLADPHSADDEASEIAVVRQSLLQALKLVRDDFELRTWQAFWRTQIEEESTEQVAAELGMTQAAVRKAKYRVLRRLREDLDGLGIIPNSDPP